MRRRCSPLHRQRTTTAAAMRSRSLLSALLALGALVHGLSFGNAAETSFDSPSRAIDFLHMRLDVTITQADFEAQRLSGIVTHQIRIRDAVGGGTSAQPVGLTQIQLDAVNLRVTRAEIGPDWRDVPCQTEGERLQIDLPRPYAPGEKLALRIHYLAEQPPLGLFFVGPDADHPERPRMVYTHAEPLQARYWLPCHDWPDTRWPCDIYLTVPQQLVAVSVGELVGQPKRPELVPPDAGPDERLWTFHWQLNQPIDPHMFGFAVGPLALLPLPELESPARGDQPRPRVLAYVVPQHEQAARYSFRHVPDMIAFDAKLIGVEYPFPQFSYVTIVNHFHGGMEHVGFCMVAPALLTTGDRGHTLEEGSQYNYVAHMIAHTWFGGLVNYRHVKEAWLNESFATYLHQLWRTQADSEEAFAHDMWSTAQRIARLDHAGNSRPLVSDTLERPGQVYTFGGGLVYWKGAWILHMLRHELGDDVFWNAVQTYVRRHRGGSVVTADLRRALEEVSGRDLRAFFDRWVFCDGIPQLEVAFEWDERRSRAVVKLEQTQAIDADHPPFAFPLELHFASASRAQNETVQVTAAEHTFQITLAEPPVTFCVDPRGVLLKSLQVDKPADMWRAQVRQGPTALSRSRAIESLGAERTNAALAALRDTLLNQQEFWGVRTRAAHALLGEELEAALPVLLQAADIHPEHPQVSETVVESLGDFPTSPAAHGAVLRHAGSDQHIRVQAAALRTLARFAPAVRDERTIAALTDAALPEVSDHVRRAAFAALDKLADARALPRLLPALNPEVYDTLEMRCMLIGTITRLTATDTRHRTQALQRLVALQDDPRPALRAALRAALNALERETDPEPQ
ncbi:MAG: HEAT repeat domain-containing protein [Planctomycetes bacterium]|nr:HEAT repeat domain-containing protein [Planctomycetota bacterium]